MPRLLTRRSPALFVVLWFIAAFLWIGLQSVGPTVSYFNDSDESMENTFFSTTLDFSVDTLVETSEGDSYLYEIGLTKNGLSDFQYVVSAGFFSDGFCETLQLKSFFEDVEVYAGSLSGFLSDPRIFSDPESWRFEVVRANGSDVGSCAFDFEFKGWQAGLPEPLSGFNDTEAIHKIIQYIAPLENTETETLSTFSLEAETPPEEGVQATTTEGEVLSETSTPESGVIIPTTSDSTSGNASEDDQQEAALSAPKKEETPLTIDVVIDEPTIDGGGPTPPTPPEAPSQPTIVADIVAPDIIPL